MSGKKRAIIPPNVKDGREQSWKKGLSFLKGVFTFNEQIRIWHIPLFILLCAPFSIFNLLSNEPHNVFLIVFIVVQPSMWLYAIFTFLSLTERYKEIMNHRDRVPFVSSVGDFFTATINKLEIIKLNYITLFGAILLYVLFSYFIFQSIGVNADEKSLSLNIFGLILTLFRLMLLFKIAEILAYNQTFRSLTKTLMVIFLGIGEGFIFLNALLGNIFASENLNNSNVVGIILEKILPLMVIPIIYYVLKLFKREKFSELADSNSSWFDYVMYGLLAIGALGGVASILTNLPQSSYGVSDIQLLHLSIETLVYFAVLIPFIVAMQHAVSINKEIKHGNEVICQFSGSYVGEASFAETESIFASFQFGKNYEFFILKDDKDIEQLILKRKNSDFFTGGIYPLKTCDVLKVYGIHQKIVAYDISRTRSVEFIFPLYLEKVTSPLKGINN